MRLWMMSLALGTFVVGCDGGDDNDGDVNQNIDADGDGVFSDIDCDDANANINPSVPEVCDGIDNDCDGLIDDADDFVDQGTTSQFYSDDDGDGFGDAGAGIRACQQPDGAVTDDTDCNDDDGAINPSAAEVCDEIDNDCDDAVDDDDDSVDLTTGGLFYGDQDNDTFGDPADETAACVQPVGTVTNNSDCDDDNDLISPDATEICNFADDNCDGLTDDDDPALDLSTGLDYYPDADLDGYGDQTDPGVRRCVGPTGTVADNTDCNDAEIAINPGADEQCDGAIDDDCDPTTTEDGKVNIGDTVYNGLGPALSAASDGDTLVVCDGTYSGTFSTSVELTIQSLNGADGVILEGDGLGSAAILTPGDDITVIGLTFRDGVYGFGGAIDGFASGVDITVEESVFEDNAGAYGGAILAFPGSLNVSDSTFTGNNSDTFATSDGPLGFGGAIYAGGDAEISNCTFEDNTSYSGGAIYADAGVTVTISETTFTENASNAFSDFSDGGEGGAIYSNGASYDLEDVTFDTNGAFLGGAVFMVEGSLTADAATTFSDNITGTNPDGDYGGLGGGIFASLSTITLNSSTTLDGNSAPFGGGIFMFTTNLSGGNFTNNIAGAGGAIYADAANDGLGGIGSLTIEDATFESNEGGFGGGLRLVDGNITVEDVDLISNTAASDGAGVYATGGTFDFTTVTFDANEATLNGGAMYIDEGTGGATTVTLNTCEAFDNVAAEDGAGLYLTGGSVVNVSSSTVIGNNATGNGGGALLADVDSTLTSTSSDWGTSTTDNDPDDVYISEITTAYTDFGSSESFDCDSTGCDAPD
ncbi:MAG: putative metal-binding motif-containing protein [Myxococcota bacterium]